MKKLTVTILAVIFVVGLFGSYAGAAPKLIVKDAAATPNEVFVVNDDALGGPAYNIDMLAPNNGLVRVGSSSADATAKSGRFVLRHFSNAQLPVYLFGAASAAGNNFVALGGGSALGNAATQLDFYTAATTTTPLGTSRMTIKNNGFVGINTTAPVSALHVNGTISYAALSQVSSRTYKDNIEAVSADAAMKMVADLAPVSFTYLTDPDTKHMGFIAEDVPDQIATRDRKGVMVTEIIAVLTKVVQEQSKTIEALSAKVDKLENSSK